MAINRDGHIKIEDILSFVSNETGISQDAIKSKRRKREVVYVRQIFCSLASHYTRKSLKDIGELIGGRDHTTVIHSKQTLKDLVDTDSNVKDYVSYINNKFREIFKPYEVRDRRDVLMELNVAYRNELIVKNDDVLI